ncbi:MAG: hypothetical protein LBK58_00735 [Prevotellaceae bacterium]|jgi:hypothetical protein|nr:hypothetical protein [Prevotellaceae bacterium]
MKRRRPTIEPLVIRGDEEFFSAFGIPEKKQAEMRTKGLPCYHDGKCFIYFPDEVSAWIKENWKMALPTMPEGKKSRPTG